MPKTLLEGVFYRMKEYDCPWDVAKYDLRKWLPQLCPKLAKLTIPDKLPDNQYYDAEYKPAPKEKATYVRGFRFENGHLTHYSEEIITEWLSEGVCIQQTHISPHKFERR